MQNQFNLSNVKTIAVHLTIWVVLVLCLNSRFFDLEWGPMSRADNTLLIPLLFGMFINAILFYSNAYYFIPKYLHGGQSKRYWKLVMLLLLGLSIFELSFDAIYLHGVYIQQAPEQLTIEQKRALTLEFLFSFMVLDLLINTLYWAIAFLYRLPKDWLRNERQKQQLIQDKLTAELDFLKAQINPHFLFNGINSIYHLMEADVKKAQKILLEFSELLRYQLYECKEDFIPLEKELQYVANYLAIENIRKGEDAIIKVELPKLSNLNMEANLKIAPLLISPFLENAFKYLSLYSEREKNELEVNLTIKKQVLRLFVRNTMDPMIHRNQKMSSSGIGLKNIRRRLELLYPQKYELSLFEKDGYFEVNLKIDLI